MRPASNLKTVFRRARRLLADEARWTKGDYDNGEGAYCLIGACFRAAGGRAYYDWSEEAFEAALAPCIARLFPRRPRLAQRFNDSPATTHADVLAVLDCALAATGKDAAGDDDGGAR